jgi:methylmalonyl-CoA mutase N-terminal domain/subunit
MPSIIAAVKEYASIGEIVQVMKDVYGEFEEPIFF